MRIPMVILLMTWASTPVIALDAEKQKLEQGQDAALSDGRFELDVTQMQRVPTSADGRFKLDSGFDPQASRPVSDARYTLHSVMQSKAATLACGPLAEAIFSNGFEGP